MWSSRETKLSGIVSSNSCCEAWTLRSERPCRTHRCLHSFGSCKSESSRPAQIHTSPQEMTQENQSERHSRRTEPNMHNLASRKRCYFEMRKRCDFTKSRPRKYRFFFFCVIFCDFLAKPQAKFAICTLQFQNASLSL